MPSVRKFDFNKSYEEVEIAGKEYNIEFNDDKLLEYSKAFDKFYVDVKKIDKIDTEKLEVEKQKELFNEMQELIRGIISILLGDDAFDEIYKASGKSTMNMISVIEFLSDIVGEKMEKIQKSRKSKYIPKKSK